MLILSIIFVSLIILLVFCLSKDTGEHTAHARKDGFNASSHDSLDISTSHNSINSSKSLNAN